MKKLVILLAVLALCLPAFAADPNTVDILIYKIKGKIKGIDIDAQEKGKLKIRAYLVMDVNLSIPATPDINLNDPCSNALIVYGKDANGTVALFQYLDTFMQVPTGKKTRWGIRGSWPFPGTTTSQAVAVGRAKARNIGTGTKRIVAKRMKGKIIANGDLLDYGNNVIGSGKFKLKLRKKLTRAANKASMTLPAVVAAILADLPKKPKIP